MCMSHAYIASSFLPMCCGRTSGHSGRYLNCAILKVSFSNAEWSVNKGDVGDANVNGSGANVWENYIHVRCL